MKEVGHVEQSRNVKTDALSHPSRFLPTAQHCRRATPVSVASSMDLPEQRMGKDKEPHPVLSSGSHLGEAGLQSQDAVPGSAIRPRLGSPLGENVLPPSPTIPSSKVLPTPGKARWHTATPPLPGQANSQTASQTSPCIEEDEKQTLKPSHSPSHTRKPHVTSPSWGENPGGD